MGNRSEVIDVQCIIKMFKEMEEKTREEEKQRKQEKLIKEKTKKGEEERRKREFEILTQQNQEIKQTMERKVEEIKNELKKDQEKFQKKIDEKIKIIEAINQKTEEEVKTNKDAKTEPAKCGKEYRHYKKEPVQRKKT